MPETCLSPEPPTSPVRDAYLTFSSQSFHSSDGMWARLRGLPGAQIAAVSSRQRWRMICPSRNLKSCTQRISRLAPRPKSPPVAPRYAPNVGGLAGLLALFPSPSWKAGSNRSTKCATVVGWMLTCLMVDLHWQIEQLVRSRGDDYVARGSCI